MHGFKSFVRKTEIPLTNEINVILGPNGSGKSTKYDTKVLLASGKIMQIGYIVEETLKKSKEIKKLNDGIYTQKNPLNLEILSLNPITMKIEPKKISAFMKRDGEKNLYTISTRTGKKVTTTECHPIMIYKDKQIISEVVKNLKKGEFIATPRKLDIQEKKQKISIKGIEDKITTKKLARFLGYIIGDGSLIKNKRVDFVNMDRELIQDFTSIIKNWGFSPKISIRKNSPANTVYFNSKSTTNSLIEFFNNRYKKEGKHIPQKILFSKKDILANLLAALFDCDASIRKDNPTFEYVTMSEQLAEDVVVGLLRFGIVARKTSKKKYTTNTKNKIKKDYYHITIEGREKLSILFDSIPIKCMHKKFLLKKWAMNNIVSNVNIDVLPRQANKLIKECKENLNIAYKPLRKKYPLFVAYIENRCSPTREGINKINKIFKNKLNLYKKYNQSLKPDFNYLINTINKLNISKSLISKNINFCRTTITDQWSKRKHPPRIKNLNKLFEFLKKELERTIDLVEHQISVLDSLANSDIFWDRISSIEKIKAEKYVYDLTIEDNHNFIANNIFVHNSNVSDALCFVLGRLSIKSMRAAKAKNLIFLGTKEVGPAKEASVELVFENSDKTFSLDGSEVSIKRIVRKNGQSIYKINGHTKTRQEVLALLAQAGIDPNGFNIILQGEIQNLVAMRGEDRRKIIEEVSGIAIYEIRKEKSLKELDKTEERLKEISAILRERTAHLNNLEKERQQALKFKKLEKDAEKYKASIINSDLSDNMKKSNNIVKEIEKKNKEIEKVKKTIITLETQIRNYDSKILSINSTIQKSTGLEQEKLNQEITNVRATLAGMNVNLENYNSKLSQIKNQKQEFENAITEFEDSINQLEKTQSKEDPNFQKEVKQKDLEKKKDKLDELEEQRKKFYTVKSELKSIKERINEKEIELQNSTTESEFLVKNIKSLSRDLYDKNSTDNKVNALKVSLEEKKHIFENLKRREIDLEKISYVNEHEIDRQKKLMQTISKMDVCPVCKSKITEPHIDEIHKETMPQISSLQKQIEESDKELSDIYNRKDLLEQEIDQINLEISNRQADLIKISNINEKEKDIRNLYEKIERIKVDIEVLKNKKKNLEKNFDVNSDIETRYATMRIEVQEISIRSNKNVGSEISFKQRELERAKISLKQLSREQKDINDDLKSLKTSLDKNQKLLEKKKKQEEELSEKFKKLINQRDNLQKDIRNIEVEVSKKQNNIHNIEQDINNFRIEKARYDASVENFKAEILDYQGVEIIRTKKEVLVQKLAKTQEILSRIGNVNMRALEVYDSVKEEYDAINDKVEIISKEKESIMKIIHQIDIKKKKTFLQTLNALNEIFSRNFSQLSTKGQVTLELENRKDPFEGGVNIIVKTGHGKYFDVTSLSGGEQTIVALSLIFAIQELNPYAFYILDEIDAALDKRNSERLARLLEKYMKRGQYIIITHNDEVISNASTLYGVSMHDGVSKILSLKV